MHIYADRHCLIKKKGLEDHQEIIQQIEKAQITLREIESPPINIIQKPGVDPNQYGESQKALGKTEHELELIKKEKQELESIVNAYERKDTEFKKALGLAENMEKRKLIGKILQYYDRSEITKEYALKLSDMVNKVVWDDLKRFIENKNVKIEEENNSLVYAGIFKARVTPGMRGRERYNQAKIEYELTSDGNKLYEIATTK